VIKGASVVLSSLRLITLIQSKLSFDMLGLVGLTLFEVSKPPVISIMPRFPETNEAPFQPNPETISPDRPPQLNETTRSAARRCLGRREPEGDGGGGSENDGASTRSLATLVASNNSDADGDFPLSSDGPEEHAHLEIFELELDEFTSRQTSDINEFVARLSAMHGNEVLPFDGHVMGSDEQRVHVRGPYSRDYQDDLPSSLRNNHTRSSNERFSTISSDIDIRSVHCVSPGPGLGTWTEDTVVLERYHFLDSPLRLTPQRRYCRGLVASHLVVRDV